MMAMIKIRKGKDYLKKMVISEGNLSPQHVALMAMVQLWVALACYAVMVLRWNRSRGICKRQKLYSLNLTVLSRRWVVCECE